MRIKLPRVAGFGLAVLFGVGQRQVPGLAQGASQSMPVFEVDTSWPKLPNNWVLGIVSSVATDKRDQGWIFHRPRTVAENKKAQAAPPVLEFDADGTFVRAWAVIRRATTGRLPSTASPSTIKTTSGLAAAV